MKKLMTEHLFQTGDGCHIHKSVGKKFPHGCVFTDLGSYVSSRYAGEHGDDYAAVSLRLEQTLKQRIEDLLKYLPGLQQADIKKVLNVLDPTLLVLCLMGDGALLAVQASKVEVRSISGRSSVPSSARGSSKCSFTSPGVVVGWR